MLHDFPAETTFTPNVNKPADLAGFTSESLPRPRPAPTVRQSGWRRPAVSGLCAGTGLAVVLALMAPGDSQSAAGAATPTAVEVRSTPKPSPLINPGPTPPAPPSLPAPVLSVAASAPIVSDEIVIRSLLDRYRGAYERLDAEAARMVWPTVDVRGLAQAFSDLDSQSMRFDNCRIDIDGARGVATCRGEATYAARAGDRSIRAQTGTWTFELSKSGGDWTIGSVQHPQ